MSSVWEKLPKSHVSSKIKKFGWRALHNVIPCLGTLANWHMTTMGQCPLCPIGFEDLNHILFRCTRAKEIWKNLRLDDLVRRALRIDKEGAVVLEELLDSQRRSIIFPEIRMRELILVAAWVIWWERGQLTHGEDIQPTNRAMMSIGALTLNYTRSFVRQIQRTNVRWKGPPEGTYMVNVDAAYNQYTGGGSSGIVI